ncbi:hypothetical protein [Dokdonia sp.]|uniref:hypothetical protein n=1 Tax=Dokdonia sp. TaxID=2024995 RepID=UPI0032652C0F
MELREIYKKRKEILNGHMNELYALTGMANKSDASVFELRKKICDDCPLKKNNSCNSNLWIHPETMKTITASKEGFIRGCGCRLSAKQKSKYSKCPAGFWGGEFDVK